jgi:hypothetical protein
MAFGKRKQQDNIQEQQNKVQPVSEIQIENAHNLTPEQLAFMQEYESGGQGRKGRKATRKEARRSKRKEKLDMYDMIIANLLAGNAIIEPTERLDNSQLAIGFSNISSDEQLSKYFMINKFPDFLQPRLIDLIRSKCMNIGVKINFYFYAQPHRIDWESPEMKNRMTVWRRYSTEHTGAIDVFAYRTKRGESLARNRIITSTKYLNEAELEHKRSFLSTFFIISVSAKRDEDSLANMSESIKSMKELCSQSEIKLTELRINMIDWLRAIGPFSLKADPEVASKLAKKVLTDDILANFNSYKQGRVGTKGVPLGIDVLSGVPVMRKFKDDPDGADNWLISAATGGGKSFWLKTLLTYLLADGFVCCVMDYEGDEYTNLANYIRAGNPEDVRIVSMGKGSTVYFDPCEIPAITGDPRVDNDLKESAINFTLSIFRIIVCGLDGAFTKEQDRVMSLAIQRMYDTAGVTDDKYTWKRSKGLRLHDVYYEIKEMVESKELVDVDADNTKHKAAVSIIDASSIYFEPGESKSGTFKQPMPANELYKAKFIVFSFGMKGATDSATDPTILALKQLSVAYVNIQISNYCKYVRHCFNVKVWEEFQRWGCSNGSAETISNSITGGRKRGDVNFIITNDLASMLDDSNLLSKRLRQNIQNYAIGKIPDSGVRQEFIRKFDQQDVLIALDNIAKAGMAQQSGSQKLSGSQSRYKNAFCIILEDGKRAICKVKLPKSLLKSELFKTGVIIKEDEE